MKKIIKSIPLAVLLTSTASIQAADFNKDGIQDLVFKSTEGYLKTWELDSSYAKTERWLINPGSANWKVFSECGDLNGDGNPDILIQDETTGYIQALKMNGFTVSENKWVVNPGGADWEVKSITDIDGNGYPDIILQNSSNEYIKAYKLSANFTATSQWIGNPGSDWDVEDVEDVDGDGIADIIMQNDTSGYIKAFKLGSDFSKTEKWIGNPGGVEWDMEVGASDIDGDGIADIVLQSKTTGYVKAFKLSSDFSKTDKWIGNPSGSDWEVTSVSDLDGDGVEDIVLQNETTGYVKAYQVNSTFSATSKWIGNPGGSDWEAIEVEDMDGDGQSDVVFQNETLGYVKAYDIASTFAATDTWIGNAGSSWNVDVDGNEDEDKVENKVEDETDDIGTPPSIPDDSSSKTTISHNGVIYATVISPYTGKVWLDRNLGASQVCTTLDDEACYGDYYQWGRNTDGHEKVTSSETWTEAIDINQVGTIFIKGYDWTSVDSDGALRAENWSSTDGTSICPVGYRVPSREELILETIDSVDGVNNQIEAYNNFLKLPSAGSRNNIGDFGDQDNYGYVWSISNGGSSVNTSHNALVFTSSNASTFDYYRANGYSVRCIKDSSESTLNDTTAPVYTSLATASVNENQISALTLIATDAESTVTYSISGTDSEYFNIDSSTGVVSFVSEPDYETKTSYTLTATAKDNAENTTNQNVTIYIVDVNEVVQTGTITHNGSTYGTVTSPYTGKVWLDRNLGASRVCTALDDTDCYGDYYQWGRNADGHEKTTSSIVTVQSNDITTVGHSDFILGDGTTNSAGYNNYDWAYTIDADGSQRIENWNKADGTSICPSGYRVPTSAELLTETVNSVDSASNNTDAYNNFLKIPSAGYRDGTGGYMVQQGSYSAIWSTLPISVTSGALYFSSSDSGVFGSIRNNAWPVRCIKN